MNIKEILPDVFAIEDYVTKKTCKILIESFSKDMQKTPRKNIMYGISGTNLEEIIYNDSDLYNTGINVYKQTLITIEEFISKTFNAPYKTKSHLLSCMKPGAFISQHIDNSYKSAGDSEWNQHLYEFDISALLYLNDDYEGGELYFTKANVYIKPKPGTLIFFRGDQDKPHEVKRVLSGDRYNLVLFYEPVN